MIRYPQSYLLVITMFAHAFGGCRREAAPNDAARATISVYCSVDESFAKEILDQFSAQTGIPVIPTFDSEAGKTTGLVQKIIAEHQSGRPRADVFWSGEIFNTIQIAKLGMLKPYAPKGADTIPDRFKDPQNRWTAVAVRARVIAFDPAVTPRDQVPTRWEDFADPRFARHTAIANPLFGTTRGHVAAMFALWGPQRGRSFLEKLAAGGAMICDGNSATVRALLAGQVQFAFTDTDDVWVARKRNASIDLIYPDMDSGGTLLIPCTIALIAGRPDTDAARKLADFLVSEEVERKLFESKSGNVSVREQLRKQLNVEWPPESLIDYEKAANAMDEAVSVVRETILR